MYTSKQITKKKKSVVVEQERKNEIKNEMICLMLKNEKKISCPSVAQPSVALSCISNPMFSYKFLKVTHQE